MWYGDNLEQDLVARAGDFVHIPADMPHQPYNLSDVESCVALIARTDPNDQESIVLLPELDRRRGPVQRRALAVRGSSLGDTEDKLEHASSITSTNSAR